MKMDIDQIHRMAFEQYQRYGHVTLSGELARELFTNIPNREKQLDAALEAQLRRNRTLADERHALKRYAERIERTYIVGHEDRTFSSDEEAWARVREEREKDGVAHLFDRDE